MDTSLAFYRYLKKFPQISSFGQQKSQTWRLKAQCQAEGSLCLIQLLVVIHNLSMTWIIAALPT